METENEAQLRPQPPMHQNEAQKERENAPHALSELIQETNASFPFSRQSQPTVFAQASSSMLNPGHFISGLSEPTMQSIQFQQPQGFTYAAQINGGNTYNMGGTQIPILGQVIQMGQGSNLQQGLHTFLGPQQYMYQPPQAHAGLGQVIYTLQGARSMDSLPIQQQMLTNAQMAGFAPAFVNGRPSSDGLQTLTTQYAMAQNGSQQLSQNGDTHGLNLNLMTGVQGMNLMTAAAQGMDGGGAQMQQGAQGRGVAYSDGTVPLLQGQLQPLQLGSQNLPIQFLPSSSSYMRKDPLSNIVYTLPQQQVVSVDPTALTSEPKTSLTLIYIEPQQQNELPPHLVKNGGNVLDLNMNGNNGLLDLNLQHEIKTQQYLKEAREKLGHQANSHPPSPPLGSYGQQNGVGAETNAGLLGLFESNGLKLPLAGHRQKRVSIADPTVPMRSQYPLSALNAISHTLPTTLQQLGEGFNPGGSHPLPTATRSTSHLGRSSEGTNAKFRRLSNTGQGQGQGQRSAIDMEEGDEELIPPAKFAPMSLHQIIKPKPNARLTDQEKNRNAQRRFRERQKERVMQLEGEVDALRHQLLQMGRVNAELSSTNAILERSLQMHEMHEGGGGGVSDGLMNIATAAAALSNQNLAEGSESQANLLASISDLPLLIVYWRDGVKSLIRLLVKTEAGGIAVTPQAVQASQAMTEMLSKLSKSRPDLIRLLASTNLETHETLLGACELSSSGPATTHGPQQRGLNPSQQHWRAVLSALGASGVGDEEKASLSAASQRYHSLIDRIMEERSGLLSSCLLDPMEDPSLLLAGTPANLLRPPPFKSMSKFQTALDNLKANLHREHLAFADLDSLVIRMILSPEQVAHARCLSYPVPLDALGLVEAVEQVDGKRLLNKSTEAQLASVREASLPQPLGPLGQHQQQRERPVMGDTMEGSDELAGTGEGEEGEDAMMDDPGAQSPH